MELLHFVNKIMHFYKNKLINQHNNFCKKVLVLNSSQKISQKYVEIYNKPKNDTNKK